MVTKVVTPARISVPSGGRSEVPVTMAAIVVRARHSAPGIGLTAGGVPRRNLIYLLAGSVWSLLSFLATDPGKASYVTTCSL